MTLSGTTFANPIIAAGVVGLCELYADRAVTPVEACEAYLSRIVGLDNALNAYLFLDAEGALAAAHESAARWRRGEARSRLDGVPVAVKANVAVEGWPWSAGFGAHRERLAEADAGLVARLRAAGAVLLGATNMYEGAFGATGSNPHFGRAHNPWDFARSTGGSSGGSGAAVAAGLCAAAIGTDTLGSIRMPAAFCGVVGHRPTPGLVPLDGVAPMSWTLDSAGPLARSPLDAARLFAAICAEDAELAADIAEPADTQALAHAPLAVLETGAELAPAAAAGLEAALARANAAGLTVDRVRLDIPLGAARDPALFVAAAESAAAHAGILAEGGDGVSPAYRARLEALGATRAASELARAYQDLKAAGEAVREAMAAYAAVLLPTSPAAPFAADGAAPVEVAMHTTLANVAGLCATAFPAGLDDAGLPRSVMAMAWDDETALGLAQLLAEPVGAPPAYRG